MDEVKVLAIHSFGIINTFTTSMCYCLSITDVPFSAILGSFSAILGSFSAALNGGNYLYDIEQKPITWVLSCYNYT